MVDFAAARRAMVDSQLLTGGVLDRRVLRAMGAVPRERFVPAARRDLAYLDDLHILGDPAGRRYLSAPTPFARLLQLARIEPGDAVLDCDAGPGYSAAVLAKLSENVVALERDPHLASVARANLAQLGHAGISVVGSEDDLAGRQFDVIVLERDIDGEPTAGLSRLRRGGRLVALVRQGLLGVATLYEAGAAGLGGTRHFSVTLPAIAHDTRPEEFVF